MEKLSDMGLTFPSIFMTGSDDELVHREAVACGCAALLRKLSQAHRMIDVIKHAIGSTESMQVWMC